MKIAELLCTAHSEDAAWDCICAHPDAFFWTDGENHADTWNRYASDHAGGHPLAQAWRGAELWFTYRGLSIQVPLQSDRSDRWRTIHALAHLVHMDCEFRFCKDSSHASDQAYLALPAADWEALESAVDAAAIARRFLKLDPDVEVFLAEAFPSSSAPPGSLEPAMTNWVGGPSYMPTELDYVLVSEGPGHLVSGVFERLVEQYLEPGQVGISTYVVLETQWVDQGSLGETVVPLMDCPQVRIVDSTRHGFLVIEQNGVAAGWRTDGRQLQGGKEPFASRRWWKFWKHDQAPN